MEWFRWVGDPNAWVSLVTLTFLEISSGLTMSSSFRFWLESFPLPNAFLILIGVVLVADGLGQHIERGYIYFAMAFSTIVEMLNIRVRSRR
jgi:predicted tellurium resistance membrane protein TerC